LLLPVALLLAACGEQPPSGSQAPTSGPSADAEQVLRLSYSEVSTLDPAGEFDGTLHLLVRGLTGLDQDMRTIPAIAESWDVTEDGTHLTFHLREARYSNGDPIVAADFVYGWRRLLDPRVGFGWGYLLADLVGAADLLAITPDSVPADEVIDSMLDGLGVSAPDERTLEVDLARPAAYFATVASFAATAPVSESWITRPGATEGGAFVSSGPFVLTEWVHDQRRTFEPNPMWWGAPTTLRRIEMRVFDSDEDAVEAFRHGEIDLLDLAALTGAEDLDALAEPRPGSSFWFIGFDMLTPGSPTARSAELRRALSLAIDRGELNAVVGFNGPVAGSPIPPGVPGHDPDLAPAYDPVAARQSLAQALDDLGLTDVAELHLTFIHGTMVGDGPRHLELQWRTVLGIEVEFVQLEPDQYFERLSAGHDFDMFWLGWYADYPHPQSYLEPLWGCQQPLNNARYCNVAFDELLDRAARTGDIDSQLTLYAEAQRLLVDDTAAIFLQWPGTYALVAPWVEGLVLTPMDDFPGILFLDQVRITARD
jgi:ABC-type oligopeptide transport system substrate-binding subunit